MTHFEKAIKFIKDNRSWSDAEESVALQSINHLRCDINFAAPAIADGINDLLEEYGEDNDLPEGWWLEYVDNVDDVFFRL